MDDLGIGRLLDGSVAGAVEVQGPERLQARQEVEVDVGLHALDLARAGAAAQGQRREEAVDLVLAKAAEARSVLLISRNRRQLSFPRRPSGDQIDITLLLRK